MSTPRRELECLERAADLKAEADRLVARLSMTRHQWAALVVLADHGPLPLAGATTPHAHVDQRAAGFLARRGLVDVVGQVTPRSHRQYMRTAQITPAGVALLASVRNGVMSEP